MFPTVKPMKNIKPSIANKRKLTPIIKEQSLIPVLEVKNLLAPEWCQDLLEELNQLAAIPEKHYQKVYHQLVVNFAEFVQVLPSVEGGQLGSLFDEGLNRALIAMRLHQLENGGSDEPVFTYAIFSAALLIDLRKVFVNKKIMISDENGCFISEWLPFAGNISEFGKHYKIRRFHRPIVHLSTYLTLLLARQVMPKAGFLWLASDMRLLSMWMAALVGDEDGAGSIGYFLNIAKKHLREKRLKRSYAMPVEISEPSHTVLGEKFWAWLKQRVANDQKGLNPTDPSIHATPDGIFLKVPEIFQEFCVVENLPNLNWKDVAQRFGNLGIAEFIGPMENNLAQQKFVYLDKDKILQVTQATQQNTNFKENDDAKNLIAKFFTNANAIKGNVAKEKFQKHTGMLNMEYAWFSNVSQKMSLDQNLQIYSEKLKESKRFSVLEQLILQEALLENFKVGMRFK